MGILINADVAASIDPLDGFLIDIARSAQVPKTKHEEAIEHYTDLCQHVDRQGSPLEGRVVECFLSRPLNNLLEAYGWVLPPKSPPRLRQNIFQAEQFA